MSKSFEFSKKYDQFHAERYHRKHEGNHWRRQLTTYRERLLLRKTLALAPHTDSVLDLPCGTGRFWPVLAEVPNRVLWAADNSTDMIETAKKVQPPAISARFQCFQSSAMAIEMPDQAVDHIVCMRLLHHIHSVADRLQILREFHRVTRHSVTVSLWVDGNWQGYRWKKKLHKRPLKATHRLLIPRTEIEQEFQSVGFNIVRHFDILPKLSMWRLYLLEKA